MNQAASRFRRKLSRLTVAFLLVGATLSVRSQSQVQVGYTIVTADEGTSIPVGVALFSYTNSAGVLVSQAGVGAVEPALSGRIFVDEAGTQTGIALANPSAQRATVSLVLRDASGREVERKNETLEARQHLPRYVRQIFNVSPGFVGSLNFQSDVKVAAVTLREGRNAQGEPLYTTLPVIPVGSADSSQVVFSQVAAGEGYSTQLVLINATAETARGKIRFTSSDGKDLVVRLSGVDSSEFSYEVAAQGTYRAEFQRSGTVGVGYTVLTPDPGNLSPSGTAIFSYTKNNSLVTEAGVAATTPTASARVFVDNAGTYTGVAIANPAGQLANVSFSLLDRYGTLVDTASRTIPARGHLAKFVHELFPGLSGSFTGLLEISSTQSVHMITLRQTDNSRGELVLTTLPVADLTRLSSATSMTFPHIANGDGFSTRLIIINTNTTRALTGKLNFYESSGAAMVLSLGGKSGSEFAYEVAGGGGKQFLPGNSAKAASIQLIDPSSDRVTKEIVVNEGNRLRATVQVLDSSGSVRDDFEMRYTSLSSEVATIDGTGSIEGEKAGFSTLAIESGGVIATGTITVVKVDAGFSGYEITGIAQDLSRRLYLAATSDHTILLAQHLKQKPAVYAGVTLTGGLKNDARLQSWFKNPAFLAFHQSEGSLYVSDAANHVIRKVSAGASDRVETLAGIGTAGSSDGPLKDAAFNNPQGIALDSRGFLWVADSGNHTIRRIDLVRRTAQTIAGKKGSAGWVDGTGSAAQFSSPAGLAVETETTAQQQERELRGGAPAPVRVLVADSGNGVIRRVSETGEVETLRPGKGAVASSPARAAAGSPLSLSAPSAVAADPLGTIYVTESAADRVTAILRTGEVVPSAQSNTFNGPRGLVIAQGGRIVVADRTASAREIVYGEPRITSITPDRVGGKGGVTVTITGKNFAPDTLLIVAGLVVTSREVRDSETVTFIAPALPSGRTTVTVQTRGGLDQSALLVDAIPLADLPAGSITTLAGGTTFAGDGAAATSASLRFPRGVLVDGAGNLFVTEGGGGRIRRLDARTGVMTTLAGRGEEGFEGDNGPALTARLSVPSQLAIDTAGNIFVAANYNKRIRRIDAATGIITTVAGDGSGGVNGRFAGDEGLATRAALSTPLGVAVDTSGNLFIADTRNHRVRRVDAANGIIRTVAGTGKAGYSGDDGPATSAALNFPTSVALDALGNLFIADMDNHRVRRLAAGSGVITTVAGNGQDSPFLDGVAAVSAAVKEPRGVAFDNQGRLFIVGEGRVRKVDLESGIITTVAGNGDYGSAGDGGLATGAPLAVPESVAIDAAGNLLIADGYNHRIRRVDAATGIITTVAGSTAVYDGGPAAAAALARPSGLAVDSRGNILIADRDNARIRRVDAVSLVITTVAGNGVIKFSGDNQLATDTPLWLPPDVAFDPAGNILIADGSNRVRKVDAATGLIRTLAGTSDDGYFGDGGPAAAAMLKKPQGIAVDSSGNILIADTDNHVIRRVDALTKIITTVAGNGKAGYGGDNGPATAAALNAPIKLAVDRLGNIFIADSENFRIRKVSDATGTITTYAGTGRDGFSGDNGLATAADIQSPRSLVLDAAGNLFFAANHRIRRVDAATGVITTVAGSGAWAFSGDGGPARAAALTTVEGMAWTPAGDLLLSNSGSHRLRIIRGPVR